MVEVRQLTGRPDPIIFEVGSADGLDSLRFLEEFSSSEFELHCFEPDPRHRDALLRLKSDPRVRVNQVAIGPSTGEATFHQTSTIYSSSLKQPNIEVLQSQWPEIDLAQQIPVPVVTLDDYCVRNEVPRIDFLWADVQGAEDFLIIGGKSTFKDRVRYFYTEYSDTAYYQDEPDLDEIRRLLGDQYQLVQDYGTDALFRNTAFNPT